MFIMRTKSFFFFFFLVISCAAKKNKHCDPSSCGSLRNISYPFRLTTDPSHCGEDRYELACENNQTILHLFNGKYYVQSISYNNLTIRILDPGLAHNNNHNCSSLPLYSLSRSNFNNDRKYPYDIDFESSTSIAFVTCPFRVNSPDLYKEITSPNCSINANGGSATATTTYVVPGTIGLSDLKDSCRVKLMLDIQMRDMLGRISREFEPYGFRNFSFYEIHRSMAMGIELTWYRVYCGHCFARGGLCSQDNRGNVVCYDYCLRGLKGFWRWWRIHGIDIFSGTAKIIGCIMAGRTSCGILCLLAFLVYTLRRRHLSSDEDIERFLQDRSNQMAIRYSYSEIKSITQGFKNKLGQGGFGSVFKGMLRSGRLVAIKMLGSSKGNGQDFINEVATIGRIHHINVVKLIGFCAEGQKRALVYDFMPNGSLEKYIFSQQENNISLSWEKMHDIALGAARGIQYLHQGCNIKILHFDIKPHNILLDKNFIPKISDFGLAKLYPVDDSIVTLTAARGTIGYIAPELFYKNIGGVSYKSDIYSFGMLLMEMAGRRKNLNAYADHSSEIYFPLWVYNRYSQGEDIEMEDATEDEKKIVKKLAITALWCIQMKPIDRPTMKKVLEMLEGDINTLQMPPKPFLSSMERTNDNGGSDPYDTDILTSFESKSISCNSMESTSNINVD